MDIAKELEEAKRKREETINKINQVVQEHQQLLQELLRLDGETRALERVSKNDGQP